MFNLFAKNSSLQASLASWLILMMIFLAGAWVLLYPKPAQALADVIGGPSQVLSTIMGYAKWTWEKIKAAAAAARDHIRTAYTIWQKSHTVLAEASRIAA